jgi:hypothetical protein
LSSYWSVPPLWRGETCFILAGGPSLRFFDCGKLKGRRVIAINDCYKIAPFADILYFCDNHWFGWHNKRPEFVSFPGMMVTLEPAIEWRNDIHVLRNPSHPRTDAKGKPVPKEQIYGGLSDDPTAVVTGKNSGYQAIGLAVHLAVKRIVLLGYDMRHDGKLSHWFGDHIDQHGNKRSHGENALKTAFLPLFPTLIEPLRERGIDIINATPGSALTCFPTGDIEEILCREPITTSASSRTIEAIA